MLDTENSLKINKDDPNLQVVNLLTKKSQPRAKHDIIGSSDDEDDVGEKVVVKTPRMKVILMLTKPRIVVPDTYEGL